MELREATGTLPRRGVGDCISDSATEPGERRLPAGGELENRIVPYLDSIWPTARERKTKEISASLANLCVAAGDAFPFAVDRLKDWFQPLSERSGCIYQLHKSGLCQRFPQHALKFLDALIGDELLYWRDKLSSCLQQIRDADSSLEQDPRFRRPQRPSSRGLTRPPAVTDGHAQALQRRPNMTARCTGVSKMA